MTKPLVPHKPFISYDQLKIHVLEKLWHMLILGKAGSGKSELIRWILKNLEKRILLVAPTGMAAQVAECARTIHSAFGINPNGLLKAGIQHLSEKQRQVLFEAEVLIVDEISMVHEKIWKIMDETLQEVRNSKRPFGGIRLLLLGDLFQLPPIFSQIEFDEDLGRYDSKILSGDSILGLNMLQTLKKDRTIAFYDLRGNFRQNDVSWDDQVFRLMLDQMRTGEISEELLQTLNLQIMIFNSENLDLPFLTSTNKSAQLVNNQRIIGLNEIIYTEHPFLWINPNIEGFETIFEDHPLNQTLLLAKGMKVIMNLNDTHKRWVNGSRGVLERINLDVDGNPDTVEIRLEHSGEVFEVRRAKLHFQETLKNPETNKEEVMTIGFIEQYPFVAGYALTIHKSQGMTLEGAIIDLGRGAFAYGQAYVAFSRVRSPKKLYFTGPVTKNDFIVSKTALNFINMLERDNALIGVYPEEEMDLQRQKMWAEVLLQRSTGQGSSA